MTTPTKAPSRVKLIEAAMGRLNRRITARLVEGGKYPIPLFRAVHKLAALRAEALGDPEQAAWIRSFTTTHKGNKA